MDETGQWHILFTMDCLPPTGHKTLMGPSSWRTAEHSIDSFMRLSLENGCKPTLFAAPACLPQLKDIIQDCAESGGEPGLLCHPQLSGYQNCLGYYSLEKQREVIRTERETWENHMGTPATTVRTGFFSANDYTFQALCMEGFSQGSCSLPGRIDHRHHSHWQKAPLYPHHTDPLSRDECGSMEFYELPVGSCAHSPRHYEHNLKIQTPPHLRIESPHINEKASSIFETVAKTGELAGSDIISFVFVTSNAVEWGGDNDPHVERFLNLRSRLERDGKKYGCRLVPATPAELHRLADRAWTGRN